ncbi:hypothetical protein CVU82_02315 [Candidatus Falkowbacteria bacterium HGW-Falkowbacteria-1]|jgi:hypothetical protein|uniref:Uncharacterized protein n=1 Tax=Candidatus Falkowbacteria bacterium HGW-Falkowbacteria-1 TaxID=2013768 RepID=A0A2N2E9L5_9BACT|nr:MAG: hypothetical protein CVU82_02315 [Candidatus Falkowbacteria bacterium HGW-Falkowbacteria-1]
MGKINVNFRGDVYMADISISDFKISKAESPWEKITIKGFGDTELIVSIEDLTLIGPNLGSATYCLKTYTGDIKNKKGTQ